MPATALRRSPDRGGARAAALELLEPRALLAAAPAGGEFIVNAPAANHQRAPALAADADGDFVVVWKNYDTGGPGGSWNIQARRYDASGAPLGPQFALDDGTDITIATPAVAMDDDGDFVVVWKGADGQGDRAVQARLYRADGTPRGAPLVVDGDRDAGVPTVAMDADGDFVVAWTDTSVVYARRFSAAGAPLTDRLVVQPHDSFNLRTRDPVVAADAQGNFVVAWEHDDDDFANDAVRARLYTAAGVARGPAFPVNPGAATATNYVEAPRVAMDADGDWAVAWTGDGPAGLGAYARAYAAAGDPRSPATRAFDFVTTAEGVSMDATGGFVIVARCPGAAEYPFREGFDVCARRFNPDATPREAPFRVNTFTEDDQNAPAVAMDDEGDFIVAWERRVPAILPNEHWTGIAAQRYDGDAPVPPAAVQCQYVFYADSNFDSFGRPALHVVDSRIDATKAALLPGQRPTFANVTGYDDGLNGVVLDVANLPRDVGSAVTLADFDFGAAAAPVALVLRRGAGPDGSDRLTFYWHDNNPFDPRPNMAVANGWLTVTAKANANTALPAPHVFSFGNLVGETGDAPAPASATFRVSALDLAAVRRAMGDAVQPLSSPVDLNHDRRVNALDLAIVKRNLGRALAPPPTPPPATTAATASAPASPRRVAEEVLTPD